MQDEPNICDRCSERIEDGPKFCNACQNHQHYLMHINGELFNYRRTECMFCGAAVNTTTHRCTHCNETDTREADDDKRYQDWERNVIDQINGRY